MFHLLIATALGYLAYWLSLATPGWRFLRPLLGYSSYDSLKSMAKLMFWGWIVIFGIFLGFLWAGVGAWADPSDGDKAMAVLSAPFMIGIIAGYVHFLRVPVESWRR